ncbi:MAG: chromosomal replication initiator protein DnaA [Candidatus Yanofskybacteria bacterium CG10_big_fil_rev_8_21_14_0_10_37_15]|uniref:Chromosomal replication initiator protein DnaA n=1 Tax=Candidatus Yanofskybacteria bacterium CG10_big_fil_rev_8_21_14_0_10_37_15 TaxID=1975097 RepID=A0A2H0R613_9BACT|nr:MAG: chromosomal replication initiator protein DnaA [Candidatus Yanofskybacteria bacterium CG10_big_fil_rev_8_21_14_0_10_37_15]
MTNEELWKAVLGEMELSVSRANFTTWFKNTSIISRDKNCVLINVPNGFIKEWLENKFNRKILDSIRILTPEIREIKYSIGKPRIGLLKQDFSKALLENEIQENSKSSQNDDLDKLTNLNKKYTFESFVVGSNNELAHAASLRVTKDLGKLYNPLFLYGGVGLGKTHLLQAIGNKVSNESSDKKVMYISAEKLTSEIVESIGNKTIENLKQNYAKLDLLMIDDIQFIAGKTKTQDIVFSTFNELYGKNKQILLSSDRPPQAIPALEERLRSRFQGGMIADVGTPDFETRVAILKMKLSEKNAPLEEGIVSYIATHIQKNVRELEGALNRVLAFSQIYNKIPDLKEVKNILNAYLNTSYQKTSPQTILKSVADFYSISSSDLLKRSRKKEVVKPRQVAMFLLREETKLSFPEIGQKLGGRDHSTVIHACEKIKNQSSIDEDLKQEMVLIKERVYNSFDNK